MGSGIFRLRSRPSWWIWPGLSATTTRRSDLRRRRASCPAPWRGCRSSSPLTLPLSRASSATPTATRRNGGDYAPTRLDQGREACQGAKTVFWPVGAAGRHRLTTGANSSVVSRGASIRRCDAVAITPWVSTRGRRRAGAPDTRGCPGSAAVARARRCGLRCS